MAILGSLFWPSFSGLVESGWDFHHKKAASPDPVEALRILRKGKR
jgi:hypothetical protein